MTKFEELTDIIARKKIKNESKTELDNDIIFTTFDPIYYRSL